MRPSNEPRTPMRVSTLAALLLATALVAPAQALTGGPDPGGYYFTDSDEPLGPPFSWYEIYQSGTATGLGDEDEITVTLPFDVEFYGTTYTEITIAANGAIVMGGGEDLYFSNPCIPGENFAGSDTLVAPMWDDLDPTGSILGGDIYYETIGAAPFRVFVVQYDSIPPYNALPERTFEVVFFEDSSDILFQYAGVDGGDEPNGAGATVGIQQDHSTGLQYTCDTDDVLGDLLAVLFYKLPCLDEDNDTWTTCDGDCDDLDPLVHPGAPELDNLVDDDCDGLVDEDFVAVGDLVIAEFMPVPDAVSPEDGQWIEIVNVSARDVELQGWELQDGDGDLAVIDQSLVVGASGRVLLSSNPDPAANGDLPVIGTGSWDPAAFELATAGPDEIVLVLDGQQIDRVDYDLDSWPHAPGQSTYLDPGYLAEDLNDDRYHWCVTPVDVTYDYGGSPGDYGTPLGLNPSGLCCTDIDADGWSTCDGDCDDLADTVNPDEPEVCDYLDNDCDGGIDEGLRTYGVTDSDAPQGPTYGWIDIAATGTDAGLGDGDELTVTLPFGFRLYGQFYSELTITDDGALVLGADQDIPATNDCVPTVNDAGGEALIAALWDDLDPGAPNAAVYYQTLGKTPNRQFVVQYDGVPHWNAEDTPFTFQVVLQEFSDDVLIQYRTVSGPDAAVALGASATVGVQGSAVAGTPFSCNETLILHDEQAVLFYDASTLDEDGDGYSSCDGDCDDQHDDAFPGWLEVCDGRDNDCDGLVDEADSGYFVLDSDDPVGPVYSWVDITATGTEAGLSDDGELTVALPFTFDFYGAAMAELTIGANGALVMAPDEELSTSNACLPGDNTAGDDGLIAALWDDLDPSAPGAGGVYYETQGKAPDRVFVVQWEDVPHFSQEDPFTFEVMLHETTNAILVQYEHVSAQDAAYHNGMSATAGVQRDRFAGTELSCNTDTVLHDGLAAWYLDPSFIDGDGDGYTPCEGDCDDEDMGIHPGVLEVCDGIDNDCIAATDETEDFDGDGYAPCDGDCNDLDPTISTDAVEICHDEIDNDCDGDVDLEDEDCDEPGDDDTGDDDTGDDDMGDDDMGDDDMGDDDAADDDDDTADCACRIAGPASPATGPLALIAAAGLLALRRRRGVR